MPHCLMTHWELNVSLVSVFALLLFFMALFVCVLVISFVAFKWLKSSIEEHNILFYQLNKQSERMLAMYGDCRLNKAYLIRQPFSKSITFGLNLLTMYQYDKLLQQSRDNFPYHTMIVFELVKQKQREEDKTDETKKDKDETDETKKDNEEKGYKEVEWSKWLLLEKNHCINVSETFVVHGEQERVELALSEEVKRFSLRDILDKTQDRMGSHAFFNWQLYNNNCQEFTKEVLITLNQYNKEHHEFIFRNKLMSLIIPSDFMLHVGNSLCVLYNMIEKYIYN